MQFKFQQKDVGRQVPGQSLAKELEELDNGNGKWEEVCCVQFLSVGRSWARDITSVAFDIILFAGVGARNPRVSANGPVNDDAPVKPLGKKVDIAIWFPQNNK